MKYFIIAGEASGDLHGSKLIREIRILDIEAQIECWGGDKMKQEGAILLKHYKYLAFMGFFVVLRNIFSILGFFKECKASIDKFNPDVLILIDYAGFNLRMAKYASQNHLKVFYYISPKIWAWNVKRAKKIKKYVNHMFTIFPFETEFYKKFDYEVDYVGNPLLDSIEEYKSRDENDKSANKKESEKIIALVPGSRKQEIVNSLPLMLEMVNKFENYRFIITAAPGIEKAFYQGFIKNEGVSIVYDETYNILNQSSAALVTSGTATLETALFNVPQVVCYRAGKISYHLAMFLIKVKYISLVNLILDKLAVVELIQDDFNSDRLFQELNLLLNNEQVQNDLKMDYKELKKTLGLKGASERAARKMIQYLTIEKPKQTK